LFFQTVFLSSIQAEYHKEDYFLSLILLKPAKMKEIILTTDKYKVTLFGLGNILQSNDVRDQNVSNFLQFMFDEFEPQTRALLEGEKGNAKKSFEAGRFTVESLHTISKRQFDIFFVSRVNPFSEAAKQK
jgi:hypothetical protein